MHIVIDIPEEEYIMYKEWVADGCANIEQAIIAEGIPLPKGHGRLIDADVIELPSEEMISRLMIHYAETIIEADKKGEENATN